MVDTSLNEILDDLKKLPWREHAQEIGVVCVLWTKLELMLDVLLLGLLESSCETTASVILTTMNLREKVAAIKVIGFKKKSSDQWFADLDAALNTIDEELRPERNRYVHDYWFAAETGEPVVRVQHKAKLVKPKAKQIAINYYSAQRIEVGEILALQVRILSSTGRVMDLIGRSGLNFPPPPSLGSDAV
jgi:hypothetical protein